ncbi:MAG: rhomboid family intramembrane serine protease [Saprospiraceae bacterium]
MPPVSAAVKQLILINAIFFLGSNLLPQYGDQLALYYPASAYFQPFQLVTHMFMHANLSHLFFNMFGLYMFGSALEMYWGTKRFLIFYFLCGFGAIALHLGVWYWEVNQLDPVEYAYFLTQPARVLGASGAVFGLLAGYGTMFPDNRIMLLFPPIPLKAKYFVIIYGLIELFSGISHSQSGVAHFAHVGGAIIGFLLVFYWKSRREV